MPAEGGRGNTAAEVTARHRKIVELRGTGMLWREVAHAMGMDERTVRRAFSNYAAACEEDGILQVIAVDALDHLDVIHASALETFQSLPAKDANGRIGALRVMQQIQRTRLGFVAACGYLKPPVRELEAERAKLRALIDTAARVLVDTIEMAPVDSEERQRLIDEYELAGVEPEPPDVMTNAPWLRMDTTSNPKSYNERHHPQRRPGP